MKLNACFSKFILLSNQEEQKMSTYDSDDAGILYACFVHDKQIYLVNLSESGGILEALHVGKVFIQMSKVLK